MDAEDELALATALLGVPQPNMPTKPNIPRSPRLTLGVPTEPEVVNTNATARRRVVSEGDRGIGGGRLVSCLKDAPGSTRPQRSKSVRVRFVRTPREVSQGPSLKEGAMVVGRSPPRVTEQPRVSPRVSTATRAYRRLEDAHHGYRPPETSPVPPPSPPLTLTTTVTPTPRGVAPRPVSSSPASSSRAVARVQVRGDLDTTVIGEVHRENMLRYSGELSSPALSDQPSSSVTTAPTKLRITVPTAGHVLHQEDQGISLTDDKSGGLTATVSIQGVAQRSRTRLLGDRQNIKVTYTSCQPTAPVPVVSTGGSVASSISRGAAPPAEAVPLGAGGAGVGIGHAQPQEIGGRLGTSMAARVVIRRRRPAAQEKQDSDTDSLDRIDIDHRPQVGVRRTMSLRAPARQVWTPDQSTASQAPSTEVTPATTPKTPIRRAFSLRILPRRIQQQTALSVTAGEGGAGDMDAATTANVPEKKAVATLVEKPPQEKGRGRDASSTVSKVPPSLTKEETKESASSAVPAPVPQSDLLSSCMGGLGQSSTKWLAEQNRKRALKSLEPVTHFPSAPEAQPLTVSFEYEGCGLSHKTVLDAVEKTIHRYRETKVMKIQFVPRSIVLSSMWMPNRWVVTVNNENAQRALMAGGVSFWGKEVRCRKYDDVIAEEYKRFLEKEERLAE